MGCHGVAAGTVAGRERVAPQAGAGPESESPVCGVDWVTMSDSCHTEKRRISDTRESQPGAAARTARTPVPVGFPGFLSRRLGDQHRPGCRRRDA